MSYFIPNEPANPDLVGYPDEEDLTDEELIALEDAELDRNVDWEKFVEDCEGPDWFSIQDQDEDFIGRFDEF